MRFRSSRKPLARQAPTAVAMPAAHKNAAAGAASNATPHAAPGASSLHPSHASPEAVQIGLKRAVAGVAVVGVVMCVLATLLTLLVVWAVPPPGTRDVAAEMRWTRDAPFSAAHGAALEMRGR
jgi:hypothetical protein